MIRRALKCIPASDPQTTADLQEALAHVKRVYDALAQRAS